MKKRGMSLIVLIVTITVIIILAAVVILTLSKNNPIESAKEASFKEDVRAFQDELAMFVAKDYTSKGGQRDNKINANKYVVDSELADYEKSVYKYIPSFSKKYEGKFIIINDELAYTEDNVTEKEKEWCDSLNIRTNTKTGAEKAASDPEHFYGAKIDYKTGNAAIDSDITEWKIFYSDGSNIYIIAADYVSPANLPENDGVKPKAPDSNSKGARFFEYSGDYILKKYNGSSDIVDERLKAFNSDYFTQNYTSTNGNMKAVAYMLDKDIWKEFAKGKGAEYAVGGPSLEMYTKSYSEKYNITDYKVRAKNSIGYQISTDGGKTYDEQYGGRYSVGKTDKLYISSELMMWLASPSCAYDYNLIAVYIYNEAYVYNVNCDKEAGFRPLVCLNTNVKLKEVDGVYKIQ